MLGDTGFPPDLRPLYMFCPIDVDSRSLNPVQTYPLLNKPVAMQRLFAHYSTNPSLRRDLLDLLYFYFISHMTFSLSAHFIIYYFRYLHIIPQPSRDLHPFLFGSPARWVLSTSWFVIYLKFRSPASSGTVALTAKAFLDTSSYPGSVTSKWGRFVNGYLFDKRFSLDWGCSPDHRDFFHHVLGQRCSFCRFHNQGCFFWGNITGFFLGFGFSVWYNLVSFLPKRKQFVWVCHVCWCVPVVEQRARVSLGASLLLRLQTI